MNAIPRGRDGCRAFHVFIRRRFGENSMGLDSQLKLENDTNDLNRFLVW